MEREIIRGWAQKGCAEGEESLRVSLLLRTLYEADLNGVQPKVTPYRVRLWTGAGKVVAKRVLEELHTIGFLRSSGKLTEVLPYEECVRPTTMRERLKTREGGTVGRLFDGEREPTWARAAPVQP